MSTSPKQLTRRQKFAALVFVLPLVFCSMEMVPGWGLFHLKWPHAAFYTIMAVAGAIAGALAPRNPIAGAPCGALAGVGALFAQAYVLERVTEIHDALLLLIGSVGMLPGLGLYFGVQYMVHLRTQVVSTGCPQCGSIRFRNKKSGAFFGLVPDRLCLDCGARYSPPTPYAGHCYLVGAAICFFSSAVLLGLHFLQSRNGLLSLGTLTVLAAALVVLGLVCVGMGCRCFVAQSGSKRP
jgi:hypothetical protein